MFLFLKRFSKCTPFFPAGAAVSRFAFDNLALSAFGALAAHSDARRLWFARRRISSC